MNEVLETISLAFSLPSFQRALLEAVLVGALSGALSMHVMARRLPFFVLAMSHATFPGVVLAALIGVNVFLGGVVAGLVVVALVLVAGTLSALHDTNVIGVVLAGAFGLGLLIQAAQPAGNRNMAAYLVGSILSVSSTDLVVATAVAVAVALLLWGFHKELVFTAFDPTAAKAMGYRTWVIDGLLLATVVVAMSASIPAVGTLLSVSLLTIPGLAARQWTDRMGPGVVIGALVGIAAGFVGLLVQAGWDVAAGGAISLAATALFAASVLVRWVRDQRRANRRNGRGVTARVVAEES